MKETIKKLWREYLADENAAIKDERERKLTERAGKLHDDLAVLLSKENYGAVEGYLEVLNELTILTEEKAFLKGCEFAVSFLLDAGNFGKRSIESK